MPCRSVLKEVQRESLIPAHLRPAHVCCFPTFLWFLYLLKELAVGNFQSSSSEDEGKERRSRRKYGSAEKSSSEVSAQEHATTPYQCIHKKHFAKPHKVCRNGRLGKPAFYQRLTESNYACFYRDRKGTN